MLEIMFTEMHFLVLKEMHGLLDYACNCGVGEGLKEIIILICCICSSILVNVTDITCFSFSSSSYFYIYLISCGVILLVKSASFTY